MYKLMVVCPLTRKDLDTGIWTSGRESLNSDIYQRGTVSCPHCGQFHPLEGNAFLKAEAGRPDRSLWRPNA